MECVGIMSGGAPRLMKYQVSATPTAIGVPYLVSAAGAAGLTICTTTGAVNMVGCNLDLATYATAQQADGSDPDALCTFIINPDAIWEIPMVGAAAGGALNVRDVTTASTDGLAVTTGDDWSSPTVDEALIWGYDGANTGIIRKVTSVSGTAATVTVAFPRDTVVGDNFLWFPVHPCTLQTITLSTDLTSARQDVAVATNTAEFITHRAICNDKANDGLFTSALHATSRYHFMNPTA